MGGTSAKSPKTDVRIAKRAEAIRLKVAGMTYAQVAQALDMTDSGAWQLIQGELRRRAAEMKEGVQELRQIAHERYETMIRRLWLKAMPADANAPLDYKAIHTLMNTIERDARIMGYAAPEKHQVDLSHMQLQLGIIIEEIARVIPDSEVPKVYEALDEALQRAATKENRILDVPHTTIEDKKSNDAGEK
jgi:hypothetical protein